MAGKAGGSVFQRIEKKYMLSREQYEALLVRITPYMAADEYGLSKICNIYFDTETDELVRASNEKRRPVISQIQLRLRAVEREEIINLPENLRILLRPDAAEQIVLRLAQRKRRGGAPV